MDKDKTPPAALAAASPTTTLKDLPCCPPLVECAACDVLDFPYRLPFRPSVSAGDNRESRVVPVEVTLRFRLERCPGSLALGDLLYSTTLLPGETVRLFTSDRHTAYSFDTESDLAYRNRTTSEETYFATGMARAMSDLDIVERGQQSSSFNSSSVGGGGSAGLDLGFFQIGGSVAASSYDSHAASAFARSLSQHAESASFQMEAGTRAASSTSIGEVTSRTHTQSESQDHYEASSRTFANPNRCHAVTFFFYRINKCQTLRFTLVAIERRVDDPAAPTGMTTNPLPLSGGIALVPNGLLATNKDRLEVEDRARASVSQQAEAARGAQPAAQGRVALAEPLSAALRQAALQAVDEELVREGLLAKVGGDVSAAARQRFGWERKLALPTPGVIVKGCLDPCCVCEPALDEEIRLDLDRKQLENELLRKRIDRLEKSRPYRDDDADDEGASAAAAPLSTASPAPPAAAKP